MRKSDPFTKTQANRQSKGSLINSILESPVCLTESIEKCLFPNSFKFKRSLPKIKSEETTDFLVNNYPEYLKTALESYEFNSVFQDERRAFRKDQEFESQITRKIEQNHKQGTNSRVKIKCEKSTFKNPVDSFKTLINNKNLENTMNSNILRIQEFKNRPIRQKYKVIENINNFDQHKLKITNIAPKDVNLKIGNVLDKDANDDAEFFQARNSNTSSPHKAHGRQESQGNDFKCSLINNCLNGTYQYPDKIIPGGCFQFSFTLNRDNMNEVFLYGGKDASQSNSLLRLDLISMKWNTIEYHSMPSTNQRYGHTTVYFNRKLYVFGGSARYMDYFYVPDLEIFNLEDTTWTLPYCATKSTLKVRKNHIAHNIGPYMIVHGGKSEENEYLSDTHLLHMPTLKWLSPPIKIKLENPKETESISGDRRGFGVSQLDVNKMFMNENENQIVKPPTLAYHSSCVVLPEDIISNSKINIYKFPDLNKRGFYKTKEKGLYVFGGKFNEDSESISNTLYNLRMGVKQFEWVIIETEGKPPIPRYLASMSYNEALNIIIIHGGRNDSISYSVKQLSSPSKSNIFSSEPLAIDQNIVEQEISITLNDTYVLELGRLEWIRVDIISTIVPEFSVLTRCGHSSLSVGDTLIIFGGQNENVYVGSAFLILNLSKLSYR